MNHQVDIAIVGAGAAGIAAALRLKDTRLSTVLLEARDRIGGRAYTIRTADGLPLDLGCEWLHSADRNALVPLIERAGFALDRRQPGWTRQAGNKDFPPRGCRRAGRGGTGSGLFRAGLPLESADGCGQQLFQWRGVRPRVGHGLCRL
jgi:predicted NAD/FAD-dependent oxidoreductase